MPFERKKVALVGAGGISGAHCRAWLSLPEQFELVAICDIDESRARQVAQQYHIPQVYTDYTALCQSAEVEIIDLLTPPLLHFSQIEQGLYADKQIICEKPLVSSLAELDKLREIEAKSGSRLMPIFQMRYGHGLQKLKFLKERNLTGKAYLATVETAWWRAEKYYKQVSWRGTWAGGLGGVLVNHAIHAHDMLCYILGDVKQVSARLATRTMPLEVEDCAVATLVMADGSLATLAATLGSVTEITRHRFCFSHLVAESHTAPYSNSSDPWKFNAATPELSHQIETALQEFTPLPESFAGQFYRFYRSIEQGTELPVTLADARASLELITALYYSDRTGQIVDLPLEPDHPAYLSWLPF
jgi:predicted dehydrogenase